MADALLVKVVEKGMTIVPPPLQRNENGTGREDDLAAVKQHMFHTGPIGF